jgi:hypothetical protein
MHGMDEDDVRQEAYAGVAQAARNFDPNRGASFQTYAHAYILGTIYRRVSSGDALTFASELHEGYEGATEENDDVGARDALTRLLARIVDVGGPARVGETVYRAVKDLPSGELEDLLDAYDRLLAAEREEPRKLVVVRTMIDTALTRALDREGEMMKVSVLAQILRVRERRQAAGLKKRTYSYARLQREFGTADKTIKSWLGLCDEQGIAANDLHPETLTKLARIMTPRRGPTAG